MWLGVESLRGGLAEGNIIFFASCLHTVWAGVVGRVLLQLHVILRCFLYVIRFGKFRNSVLATLKGASGHVVAEL